MRLVVAICIALASAAPAGAARAAEGPAYRALVRTLTRVRAQGVSTPALGSSARAAAWASLVESTDLNADALEVLRVIQQERQQGTGWVSLSNEFPVAGLSAESHVEPEMVQAFLDALSVRVAAWPHPGSVRERICTAGSHEGGRLGPLDGLGPLIGGPTFSSRALSLEMFAGRAHERARSYVDAGHPVELLEGRDELVVRAIALEHGPALYWVEKRGNVWIARRQPRQHTWQTMVGRNTGRLAVGNELPVQVLDYSAVGGDPEQSVEPGWVYGTVYWTPVARRPGKPPFMLNRLKIVPEPTDAPAAGYDPTDPIDRSDWMDVETTRDPW